MFICLLLNGYLGCFHFLSPMNDAAVDKTGQLSVFVHAFMSLEQIPAGGISGV